MPNIDIQDGGMLLCDTWKLFPVDDRNWELCELRVTADNAKSRKNGTVGELRWQRCGRFYSYNTIEEALLYVADNLLKAKAHGRHMELQDAIHEYRAIADSLRQAVSAR